LSRGKRDVLLNLGGVSYVNSEGLGEISAAIQDVAIESKGRIRAYGPNVRVAQILRMTNLHYNLLNIVEGEDEPTAIRSLKAQLPGQLPGIGFPLVIAL
jgi:anti-anti-sigma regulatory factor